MGNRRDDIIFLDYYFRSYIENLMDFTIVVHRLYYRQDLVIKTFSHISDNGFFRELLV
jgi:hypothetical protein